MLLSIGWLSGWIFHVTGASGRASGYGAPEIPPVPNWEALPLPLLSLPELTLCWAPPPQAARIAAALGIATPATAARLRKSRRLMRARRSFGCGMDPPSTGPVGLVCTPIRNRPLAEIASVAGCASVAPAGRR